MNYNLSALGISDLNPMQQEMISCARKHDNIVLLSPTGSGKTLAYLLSLNTEALSLVLVPSRELAIQTAEVATRLYPGIKTCACYGGRAAMDEHRTMRELKPRIIVGTPGRVLDHLNKGNFDASAVRTLVIDEFDKSLELGFHQQMSDIIGLLHSIDRRILLSATDSELIPEFTGVRDVMRLDYLGDVGSDYGARIEQLIVRSPQKDKLETLAHVLCACGDAPGIVFLNYREAVDRVSQYLGKLGFMVTSFHGAMEQKDRERALFRFQSGSANILVSTDLAARGLDIDGVENIIHYHLPQTSDAYIHRNGRTARWDKTGRSIIILGPDETTEKFLDTESSDSRDCQPREIPVPSRTKVPASRWETLYIGRGKKDKVNKVDIVGFFSKQGGLTREQLGMVKVFPSWSFAAVDRKAVKSLLQNIHDKKIKGQKTIIEPIR